MSADLIHTGHLNIIKKARELGEVIVGLLTDDVIAAYKRLPYFSFKQRKTIIENIKGVSKVIPQKSLDGRENIRLIKPDYLVHGDDWKVGTLKQTREKVIEELNKYKGVLVEIPYTKGISSTQINQSLRERGTTPDIRIKRLRRLINAKPIVRILEAHNGLSGLIIESLQVKVNNSLKEFDGIWLSSYTLSLSKGKPDIEIVDITSKLHIINDILDITTKPIIVDGDTGGKPEHIVFTVKTLERHGVSAIVIGDNSGKQDSSENFCDKIKVGKKARVTDDFVIIARVESLILKKGVIDALKRAKEYIGAGADCILIQSKEKQPDEILEFCDEYKKFDNKVPLIVMLTNYSSIHEEKLINSGVNIVIYANHLLRSAYPAMLNSAKSILLNGRVLECDKI